MEAGRGGEGVKGPTYLGVLEDILANVVQVSRVWQGGHVLRDGLDYHITGGQYQLVSMDLVWGEIRERALGMQDPMAKKLFAGMSTSTIGSVYKDPNAPMSS